MNPAALKTNIGDLPAGGALIVNSDAFTQANLNKAAYATNPLTDGSLKPYTLFEIPISTLNERSLDGLEMTSKQKDLTKNFFALGIMFWLYEREHGSDDRLDRREVRRPAGHRRGQQARAQGGLRVRRDDRDLPHPLPGQAGQARPRARIATSPATRRRRSASWPPRKLADRPLFYGSYPITPASDILHQLSGYKAFGVKTFQAEDEIAAIGAAIGASYGGALGHDRQLRPGHRAQVGGDGPGGHGRAAARRHRRPARRPVDRHADQERAGRPAPGDVRAQLGLAAADRRAGDARASASTWPSRPGGSRSST